MAVLNIFSTMRALPLLFVPALFSVTVADKAENPAFDNGLVLGGTIQARLWTEVARQAANRKASIQNYNLDHDGALSVMAALIPFDATYQWVHKDTRGQTWLCGGAGGASTLKWIIGYILQTYPSIKAFNPGQASGDDIAVWNIKTDKDTRKCRIQGTFNNGKLTRYVVYYDHESPLV